MLVKGEGRESAALGWPKPSGGSSGEETDKTALLFPLFPFSSERARVRPAPAAARAGREGGRRSWRIGASERTDASLSRCESCEAPRRQQHEWKARTKGCHGAARAPLVRRKEGRGGFYAQSAGGETQRVRTGAWPRPHSHSDVLCAQFGLETNHGLIWSRESAAAAQDRWVCLHLHPSWHPRAE